jgi:iron complex transport system permease protein
VLRKPKGFGPRGVLAVLIIMALISAICFMTLGAKGSWSFVLSFRGGKLAAMALVGYAVAVSTVMFQTIINNRILTPSIMGFDALYVFLQTLLIFFLGASTVSVIDPRILFIIEVATMVCFSLILYRFLFFGAMRSLHLLMLVGIILGVLFRSFSGFLQRIISPTDFVVLQDRLFASFNTIDSTLLSISALLIALVSVVSWRIFHKFDVMTLGRDTAISLGVDHKRTTMIVLMVVAVLVSVSTALVGPVTFFGLLVANLAYMVMPSSKHVHVVPAAVLISFICLIGGQTLLERIFAFKTALAIIIEFAGGLFFLGFVLRNTTR